MNLSIDFRSATGEDSEKICSLVNSVYRGDNAKKGWTTEADLLGGIRININTVNDVINRENNVILLALIEDKVVGCVHLEKKNSKCHLGMLSVDVDYQDKKIGRALMDESETYAKNTFGCREMEMKVIGQRTELIDYYLRRGYKLTEEKEPFIVSTHFGEPKIDNLYFIYMVKQL
ncbi:MAG TPA: GNAT family N-acetyltransferase [Ignavibacteria bacterium]|jgi:ribosomal protein S18 acetylase RimI-like enzyme